MLPPEGCVRKDVREFCADQPGGVNGAAARNVTMETTFYGARDNCPPGGAIAWPLLHQVAGGTGSFADPITFAGAHKSIPKHTRVYVQVLRKYFIMEDSCEECEHDWSHKQKYHIDLWMGTDKLGEGAPLIACENAMTRSHSTVTIDPPQGEHKPDSVNSSSSSLNRLAMVAFCDRSAGGSDAAVHGGGRLHSPKPAAVPRPRHRLREFLRDPARRDVHRPGMFQRLFLPVWQSL